MKTKTVRYLLALMAYFMKGMRVNREEEIELICSVVVGVGKQNATLDKMRKNNEIHRKHIVAGKSAENFEKFLLDF